MRFLPVIRRDTLTHLDPLSVTVHDKKEEVEKILTASFQEAIQELPYGRDFVVRVVLDVSVGLDRSIRQ